MQKKESYIKLLFESAEWSAEEKKWLFHFLDNSSAEELEQLMQNLLPKKLEGVDSIDTALSEKMLSTIHRHIGFTPKNKKAKVLRTMAFRLAAACIFGIITLVAVLIVKNNTQKPVKQIQVSSKKYNNDVEPGGNKAVLTLADGSTVVLDDLQNGTVTQQGTTKIIKLNGKLDYSANGTGKNEVLYNTVATPIGGKYQVELPDGTLVWLNAASSLHFPTAFTGSDRRVDITGEVYFEVAKNKTKPFIVNVNDAQIQVLGTHFNVMAYSDEEDIKTTLLEGGVKFVKDKNTVLLKPGQQSQLSGNGEIKVASGVNIAKVIAWKNDYFYFEGADFETVARHLARWYSVEIKYNKKIDDLFYGEIPRDTKLSDVLKALELTGKIRFKIEGNKVFVVS